MSFALDANVLLYASDSASPHHERATEFLERCAKGPEIVCLTWSVVMAYLRISTHTAIFTEPLSPEIARSNVESLLEVPHVRVLSEREGFWEAYRRATGGMSVRGNLVADAQIAAILFQHGVRVLYSSDTDFRRFDFLEVRNPLQKM
ncbi:MAG: TA system VapC family ribonuclease toxin [Thermoanaerobaculia bacterium]